MRGNCLLWSVCAAVQLLCANHAYGQQPAWSGTLPVMFINAADSINSKTDYVEATYYLDKMGSWEFESVGSAEEPLPLQIRGRGNWTWSDSFEKKSYKLKLGKKQPLLGMSANKHFALLAHADGALPFFRNAAAFHISKLLKLDYTPTQQPVELVLNGEYQGLYFLTETIRVGTDRVDIVEQQDYEQDTTLIDGGWLIELDNARDEHQLRFSTRGTDLGYLWVTYHSPEELSLEQRNYLRSQVLSMVQAIYTDDKSSTDWEELIDVSELARFYLVNEIIDNVEAFLGSCYLHKDRGERKWKFGPVWDAGHAFSYWHSKQQFFYVYDNGWTPGLINEIVKFPRFQEEIRRAWHVFYPYMFISLKYYLSWYALAIKLAAQCDARRWNDTIDTTKQLDECISMLEEKKDFLLSKWSEYSDIYDLQFTRLHCDTAVYDLQGRQMGNRRLRHGIYIRNGKKYIK